MKERLIKIFNGNIITPYKVVQQGTVVIKGDKIIDVSEAAIEVPGAVELDAKGHYVMPGFIDIHVHGGGGCDFMDGEEAGFLQVAATHLQYGTTAMLPTTLTSDAAGIIKTLQCYQQVAAKKTNGAQFLGMHLEGPYLSMNQRGAQDPAYIRHPNPDEYKAIIQASGNVIKRWSAAPELPGAIEFARYLQAHGILPSLAHTDAIYEEAAEGFRNGYTLATHFYSCMSGVTRRNAYRYAGVIETAYLIDDMDVEIIADGRHLPAPLLQLIYKIKGPDRIALVTDAMRGADMPPGDSILGNRHTGLKVIVEDGVAKLPDRSSFAGSVATANQLVGNMVQLAGVPVPQAVQMMTATPARILGIEQYKGTLNKGKDADITICDAQFDVQAVMVMGDILYRKNL
jgi:N-acetylglucosamine-6-phosphate deacetylase